MDGARSLTSKPIIGDLGAVVDQSLGHSPRPIAWIEARLANLFTNEHPQDLVNLPVVWLAQADDFLLMECQVVLNVRLVPLASSVLEVIHPHALAAFMVPLNTSVVLARWLGAFVAFDFGEFEFHRRGVVARWLR